MTFTLFLRVSFQMSEIVTTYNSSIAVAMWYLNYCSPFLYESGGSPQLIRYILYSTLALQYLVYVFFIIRYKHIGETITIRAAINQGNEQQQDFYLKKQGKSYGGIGQREYRLDQKQFKEWYLHYFGLNAIAVGGCIMYSPYFATAVFAVLQTTLFLIACAMQSCELKEKIKIAYKVIMVLVVILDILLLFSITMGVGASGYDYASKTCYLLQ